MWTGLVLAWTCLQGPETAARQELDKLQGRWIATSLQVRGRSATPADLETLQFTLELDGTTLKFGPAAAQKVAQIRVDPSRTPKALDLSVKDEAGRTKVLLAIYKLDGDTLTLCLTSDSERVARPSEFHTDAESGTTLVVLRRAAAKP